MDFLKFGSIEVALGYEPPTGSARAKDYYGREVEYNRVGIRVTFRNGEPTVRASSVGWIVKADGNAGLRRSTVHVPLTREQEHEAVTTARAGILAALGIEDRTRS